MMVSWPEGANAVHFWTETPALSLGSGNSHEAEGMTAAWWKENEI